MTQEEFADALGIPVATLPMGAGRHGIDPAARSLLILIARDTPEEPRDTSRSRARADRRDARPRMTVESSGPIRAESAIASAIRRNAAGYALQQGTRAFTPA
jgi:hypothetical protein